MFFSEEVKIKTPMVENIQNQINKKIVMVIAFKNFRDEEYFEPKEVFERLGIGLRTASNIEGTAIGVDGGEANVDFLVSEVKSQDFDAIVFVGGPGCLDSLDNEVSYKLVRKSFAQNKILAAICIAPVILARAGVLNGKKATVWSSPLDRSPVKILKENGAIYIDKGVVVDGKIITGNGPAVAKEFAEKIIEVLTSE